MSDLVVWFDDSGGIPVVVVGCPRCHVPERWVGYRGEMLRRSLAVARKRHTACLAARTDLLGRAAE